MPALTERLHWWNYLIFSPIHPIQRSPVNCNGLIAELGNTWMEKLYTPKADCVFWAKGSGTVGCWPAPLSLLRIGAASHFKPMHSAHYDFITRGHSSRVGWEEEYLSLVSQGCWQSWGCAARERRVDKCLALERGLDSNSWAAEAQGSLSAKTAEFSKPALQAQL